jgi:hypothetical protein
MQQNLPVTYDRSATAEYLQVIRQHIIYPLRETSVGESCFAAAVLIFGAVDGLGRLIHRSASAGAGDRFRCFVSRLGEKYAQRGAALWRLRNSLMHNATNVVSFMSKTSDAGGLHLEECNGYLFVHTKELLQDFEAEVTRLENELKNDPSLLRQAESRLRWSPIPSLAWQEYPTTKPAPVQFVELTVSPKSPPATHGVLPAQRLPGQGQKPNSRHL